MAKQEENKIEATKVVDQPAAETEQVKYDPSELLSIFDTILFEGEYTENVTIKGKLKVTFRTRSVDDTTAITKEIDGSVANLVSTLQEARALSNLTYSLVNYNGKSLAEVTPEDRRKLIGKIPAIVVGALSEALVKFDAKVAAAFAEGEANF